VHSLGELFLLTLFKNDSQVYHPTVGVTLYILYMNYCMIIFFYTSGLPKKDDSRICVNIQNKDGKEMNIQETKDNTERANTQTHMYHNK